MVELHHDDKGCIAEAAFQYECLKRAITLFAPVKPTSRLDFIALRDDGSPVKIQVKWIWKKRGRKICDIRRRRLSAKVPGHTTISHMKWMCLPFTMTRPETSLSSLLTRLENKHT
jgi:hypothetical protein